MSRRIGPRSPRSPMATAVPMTPQNQAASALFDQFCTANTFQAITSTFNQMCDLLELRPTEHRVFYRQLKVKLTSWKAQSLWTKLDKRSGHREYKKGTAAINSRVLIIGCGPIGLRTAIEIALLGGKAVIVEKRDRFSRNNVLHLWPFLIHDLKALGAKKFFGKFCAGAIDHISIRTLQCILLKVALLVGVEVHAGVGFDSLAEPHENGTETYGWRAKLDPPDHPVSEYEFDVLVGADGKRNTLGGFKRKEFRGKLAIAITANFINRNSQLEARVEEISGVAYIFNQKFFKDLNQQTGIDLENIVYYKDETHYFVMTAKKHSLLNKRVLRRDYDDPAKLLSRENVDQDELMNYAREAADVSTNHLMPQLDFAHNHYGQPDVAMFDFTSMFAAEHASRVIDKCGRKLLVCLVGDSLLEPFWPTGSGCARGFLSALDSAWMVRNWASGKMTPLEVMAERESIYQLLSQTTPVNLNKNFSKYSIEPLTRYPNINKQFFKPFQVRHQYEGVNQKQLDEIVQISELKSKRYEWIRDSHYLLKWFQKQLESYKNLIKIHDLTSSWRNGLALCALIHKYRPELIDVYTLDINKVAENNQLAFDIANKEFGIQPVLTGQNMAQCEVPDKLVIVPYLSQFYEYFRKESIRPAKMAKTPEGLQPPRVANLSGRKLPSTSTKLAVLNKISQRLRQRRQSKRESRLSAEDDSDKDDGDMDKENESLKRHRKPGMSHGMARKKLKEEEFPQAGNFMENYRKLEGVEPYKDSRYNIVKQEIKEAQLNAAVGVRGQNKVSELAKDLARQFSGGSETTDHKKTAPKPTRPLIMGKAAPAEICYFCKDRVYLVERHTAEGLYFHRGCLKCDYCGTGLRLGGYAFKRSEEGEAKFYCLQHLGMQREYVRARKRSFSDKDLLQKILPVLSPEKPPVAAVASATPDSKLLKPPVSPITPLDTIDGDKNKTPERIEFEPESEYEESELEQTTHNLSATLLDLSDEDIESDSDSEEDECNWLDDEELSDGDVSWAELARNYNRQMKKKLKREARRNDVEGEDDIYDDSDSDTPTIGASDADYETDTETEDYEEVRMYRRARKLQVPSLSLTPSKDFIPSSPQKDAKSPASEEIQQKRNSFFSTVSEPVRIDPWAFLGISKKKAEEVLQKVVQKEMDSAAQDEMVESSGDDVQDILDEEVIDVIDLSNDEDDDEDELQASVNEEYSRLLNTEDIDQAELCETNDVEVDMKEENGMNEAELEDRSIPSDNQFDMSDEELKQRREERQMRMNRSDQVAASVAGIKQLDVPVFSVEDVGSSDATSPKSFDILSPDTDIKTYSLDMDILPNEMTSIMQEMSSLPQEISADEDVTPVINEKKKTSFPEELKEESLQQNLPTDINSDILMDTKETEPPITGEDSEHKPLDTESDIYTVDDLLKCGLMKKSSTCVNETADSSISSQPPTSNIQDVIKQSGEEPEKSKQELSQSKFAFFSSPSEPVRIDAKSFLGLEETKSEQNLLKLEVCDNQYLNIEDPGNSSKKLSDEVNTDSSNVGNSDLNGDLDKQDNIVVNSTDILVIAHEGSNIDMLEGENIVQDSQLPVKAKNFVQDNEPQENTEILSTPSSPLKNEPILAVAVDKNLPKDTTSEVLEATLDSENGIEVTLDSENGIEGTLDSENGIENETLMIVNENLAQLNDTQCDDLSDIVSENIIDVTLEQEMIKREEVTMNDTISNIQEDSVVTGHTVENIKTEEVHDKSSSDESEAQFDTIKRRKGISKPVPKLKIDDIKDTEKAGQPSPCSPENENSAVKSTRKDSNSNNTGTGPVKMSESFYSEGNASRISSIPDSAPLASMDLEMTSGTDTDYEQTAIVPTFDIENENVEQTINTNSNVLMRKSSQDSDVFERESKTKSEIENEAIKTIDEMIISYEQSKETKIDLLMDDTDATDTEKADTITKWLRDTNTNVSPVGKGLSTLPEQLPDKVINDSKDHEDSSLPYISFTKEDSSHYESFGTPNEGFIGTPVQYTDSIENTPNKQDSITIENNIKEAEVGEIVNNKGESKEEVGKNSISYNKCDSLEGSNLLDTSIIEFKVSDDEGDRSFTVDEKFVVTRDRRKKKLKTSHSESSDFTISTPTESVESTSSVTELQSTLPSSLAVTPSTTGDSFSGAKLAAVAPDLGDHLSFSDIAMTYERDSSVSLERLLQDNKSKISEETSSLELDSTLNLAPMNSEVDLTLSKKENDDVIFNCTTVVSSSRKSISNNADSVSKSAPPSVQPIKKHSDSHKLLRSSGSTKLIESVTSPSNQSIGNSSLSSIRDDGSFYYTPNVSGIDVMDITDEKTESPKSPAPTVKSDSMLLDDRRNQIRKLENIDEPQSPGGSNILDAKRKFFCETPKPVRIDHFKLFEKDTKLKSASNSDGKNLQKGWKSLDSPTPSSNIRAAVPSSNLASGESEGMFYTPVTSVKNKPNGDTDDEGFKKPHDVRRKLITDDKTRSGMSVATELTPDERKKLFEDKRDHARNVARQRARLMSDEELGIKSFVGGKSGKTPNDKVTKTSSDNSKVTGTRPISAKSFFSQTSKDSSGSGGLKTDDSPMSDRKDKTKGLKVFKSQKSSPKMDKKLKKKKDDDEKENKDSEALKKEKKKSILSMLMPSKSADKKSSRGTSSPITPPLGTTNDSHIPLSGASTSTKNISDKKHGVMFRSRKSKSIEKEKTRKQLVEEDPQVKRETLYKELVPMFEQVLGGPDGKHSVSAVKAKIETVAPPPAKAPYTVLEPPKAAGEDFDTESEFGDTTSIKSFQGSGTVSGLSEEELAKLIKKQQKAAKRRQREQELRRLHMAQEIQRQLEEVEVKQREIEDKGVIIERALRGEGPDAKRDETELMQDWFNIVHEKNVLVRYESELMVHARELELEDRHARLEQQLRDRMSIDDDDIVRGGGGVGSCWVRSPAERMEEEQRILQELVAVVEQRDALVALLEEDRQREREQEQGLKAIMTAKGFQLSPITYANRMRLPSLSDVHGNS